MAPVRALLCVDGACVRASIFACVCCVCVCLGARVAVRVRVGVVVLVLCEWIGFG